MKSNDESNGDPSGHHSWDQVDYLAIGVAASSTSGSSKGRRGKWVRPLGPVRSGSVGPSLGGCLEKRTWLAPSGSLVEAQVEAEVDVAFDVAVVAPARE